MDFFKLIALPHSTDTLLLFEILFFFGYSILVVFLSYLFGNLILSFYYYFLSYKSGDKRYLEISYNYLSFVSTGWVSLLGLGLFPLFGVLFVLIQFLFKPSPDLSVTIFSSFFLFIVAIILLKINFSLFRKVKEYGEKKINFGLTLLFSTTLLCTFVVAFLTIGLFSISLEAKFKVSYLSIEKFFSFDALLRYLIFVVFAFLISSIGYIFKTYSADRIAAEGVAIQTDGVYLGNITRTIVALNILPILYLLMYVAVPDNLINYWYFILLIFSVLVLLISSIFAYFSLREKNARLARLSFYILILSFVLFFGSETTLLAVSNKEQKFKIAKEYVVFHENLLASAGRAVSQINGEEIYKAKCSACHLFETKLVGPPHKEVLKKYENNREGLVKFILNPIKIDPNYPPMPNQGLKPKEAEAVVDYMLKHYGPLLK
ncbi:MAG: cytochrome c [Ignavibacteria bacterium]|nr:cytochrome c [Ignavibacteria bacterium]